MHEIRYFVFSCLSIILHYMLFVPLEYLSCETDCQTLNYYYWHISLSLFSDDGWSFVGKSINRRR